MQIKTLFNTQIVHKDNNLLPNEVHLWIANLADEFAQPDDRYSYYHFCLSIDEQKRANEFRFVHDRNHFIAARGILRCLLSSYLKKSPQDIRLAYGLMGKPCLADLYSADTAAVYFNLSHSKDYACYAFSSGYEVGVDIEYIQKDININEFVPEILSADAQQQLADIPVAEQVEAFFKMWVSREAILKALGTGWLSDDAVLIADELHSSRDNILHYFETPPEYAGALYVKVDNAKSGCYEDQLAIRQYQYFL